MTLGSARVLAGGALAVGGSIALTASLVPFREGALAFEAMLFLALAVACALVGGRWPALVASVLGTLLLNYYFTEPLYSLEIASRESVLTVAVFAVVSIAVASVVDSAARRLQQATAARGEANTLAMLNRTVLGGEYDVPELLELVRTTFDADSAELTEPTDVRPGDSVAEAGKGSVLVLKGAALDDAQDRILNAFATHFGVLRDREELARQTEAARELEAGNRTRTALLAAVSHDLRTPLAGIKAATQTLRLPHLSGADRVELLGAVEESTDRLTTIVTDLLDMSRLQTGAVQPVLADISLDQVIADALLGVPSAGVAVQTDLPDVRADQGLLVRVIENLVANGIRHAPEVRITATREGKRVLLQIRDNGPGVPAHEQGRMFEPFQRLGDQHAGEGVGLGLAVARGLTEAQGGSLTASDTPGGGLTMTLDLASS